MKWSVKRAARLLAAVGGAVALAGCAGGSSGPDPVVTPELPVDPSHGLTASPAASVRAADADAHALATLVGDPENRFAPVSSALEVEEGTTPVLASDAYVRTIASDGDGGLQVVYVFGGEERAVHFRADDYGTPHHPEGYYRETEDARLRLSSETGSYRSTGGYVGHPDLRYYDAGRLEVEDATSEERRILAVFGARTAADGLPAGRALYLGLMSARVADAASGPADARELFGNVALTADFEASALEGSISGLLMPEPDSFFPLPLSLTSRFEIENGVIADGRFTASLRGVDSDPDAPPGETVRGYEGGVLGEFYGPEAEEFGGVLSARSEAHGRVLSGWMGGRAVTTELEPPSGELSVESVGIERDPSAASARRTAARVTAVESDPNGDMFVTYEIDGVEQRVHFTGSDLDPAAGGFARRIGDREYRLELSGPAPPYDSEFEHLDVGGWVVVDRAGDGTVLTEKRGFGVTGIPTPVDALPVGLARYSGRMYAESDLEEGAGPDSARTYEGRLGLDANFTAGTVSGAIDAIRDTTPGGADPDRLLRRIRILDGEIREGRLTARLADDVQDATGFLGEMNGRFFGPAAVEVGGVLEGTDHLSDTVVHGWFVGARGLEDSD